MPYFHAHFYAGMNREKKYLLIAVLIFILLFLLIHYYIYFIMDVS